MIEGSGGNSSLRAEHHVPLSPRPRDYPPLFRASGQAISIGMSSHQRRREDYTVGWVCALPIELAAARKMLDEEHEDLLHEVGDTDLYTLGRMGEHNVVLVCVLYEQPGESSAAAVAMQMKSTFPSIRFGLMVGIGGGVPNDENDIRLGDVVVSRPQKDHGGVVQYDIGKTRPSGFERTGSLNTPPVILLNAVSRLRANHAQGRSRLVDYISHVSRLPTFTRAKAGPDVLFQADYNHDGGDTCEKCNQQRTVTRLPREEEVMIHYGTVASGNKVMRDAAERDRVSAELGGVLCFEMEAAGLMNNFPCLVVRGICDYADSHKTKRWQAYAAGTAAACAKEVLSMIPSTDVREARTVEETIQASGERQRRASFSGPFAHSLLEPVKAFVPRPLLRDQMRAQLCGDEPEGNTKTLVVWGLGGSGKSQLVLDYVRQYRSDYKATFWVNARQKEYLHRDFVNLYQTLFGIQMVAGQDTFSLESAVLGVKSWFSGRNGRWLMVFDSADTIDNKDASDYVDIRHFIPNVPSLHVIIIRRCRTAKDMTHLDGVQVGAMEEAQAVELFYRSAQLPRNNDEAEEEEIKAIVKKFGYLALAINLAGAYVGQTSRPRANITAFLPEYEIRRRKLLKVNPDALRHLYDESVLTTWKTLYEAIADSDPKTSVPTEGETDQVIIEKPKLSDTYGREETQVLVQDNNMDPLAASVSIVEEQVEEPGRELESRSEWTGKLKDSGGSVQLSQQAVKMDVDMSLKAADALGEQSALPRIGSRSFDNSEQESKNDVLVNLREPPPSFAAYSPSDDAASSEQEASTFDALKRRSTENTPKAPVSVLTGTTQDSGYSSMALENVTGNTLNSKDMDDAASIVSVTESVMAAQSLAPNTKTKTALVDLCGTLLASKLVTHFEGFNNDVSPLFGSMPTLLWNFSAELKAETSHEDVFLQRSTAAFVRLNRSDITRAFKDSLETEMDLLAAVKASETIRKNQEDLPTTDEKIRLLWSSDPSGEPEIQEALDVNSELRDEDSTVPYLADAQNLIEDSKAFRLLLAKARTTLNLTRSSRNTMEKVRSETYNALGVTGKRHFSRAKIEFYIAWDPARFLLDQFEISEEADLCNVITITGSEEEVQAATCLDYIRQVWPIGGEELLLAVRDYTHNKLLSSSRSIPPLSVELSNSTLVEIFQDGDYLRVGCDGLIHAVAEAAEELAWLGAACREHSKTEQLGLCSVHVLSLNFAEPHIVITYSLEDVEQAATHAHNTSCWRALFRNAVIVQGYPTRRRMQSERGLEISLQLMLELGLADSVTMYNNGLVIDGLQSMFVPVDRSKDTIQWHYLYSEQDECMMFSRADEACPNRLRSDRLDESALEVARHFVGWTTHAEMLFGSNKVAFDKIRSSKLNPCGPGCVLEKASINGGKFITFGATVGRGKKDESLHIDLSSSYRKMVGWASRMNVILFDARDRQAWLTDGASTLLHLSRAQLSLEILEGMDLQNYHPPDPAVARGACKKALLDDSNRMLEVDREYIETTEERTLMNGVWENKTVMKYRIIRFQDMVKDNWQILNQILSLSKPPAGVELPTSIHKYIEGFDFVDIVNSDKEMIPRTLPLGAHGRAWLDFAKAIRAITLFGTGFGQLVIPAAGSNKLCEHWSGVPKGFDYLVASVAHLEQLRELRSESQASHPAPIELCKGIYWHRGHWLFEPCNGCTTTRPCNRTQSLTFGPRLYPSSLKDSLAGAVVFGKTADRPLWESKHGSHTELLSLSQSQSEQTDETALESSVGTSIEGDLSRIAPLSTSPEPAGASSPSGRVTRGSGKTREPSPATDPRDRSGQSEGGQPEDATGGGFKVPWKGRFRRYLRLR